MSTGMIIAIIHIAGMIVTFSILYFKTDAGGWSDGGCSRTHFLTSFGNCLMWEVVAFALIFIIIREIFTKRTPL